MRDWEAPAQSRVDPSVVRPGSYLLPSPDGCGASREWHHGAQVRPSRAAHSVVGQAAGPNRLDPGAAQFGATCGQSRPSSGAWPQSRGRIALRWRAPESPHALQRWLDMHDVAQQPQLSASKWICWGRIVAVRTNEYNITRLWRRTPARDGETQQHIIESDTINCAWNRRIRRSRRRTKGLRSHTEGPHLKPAENPQVSRSEVNERHRS